MEQDTQLRNQLEKLMRGGQAFQPRQELLKNIKLKDAGKQVHDLPYTLWELLEHLRIAQHDILDFCRNPNYRELEWPDEYWPEENAPASQAALDQTLAALENDLEELVSLIKDPANDLFAPIPHGEGQTLLREAMLVAEHSAYHLGEIIVLRRLLGEWA